MESKTNYSVVGFVVIILMLGLLTAGLWLSVGFDQRTYNTYIVYIRESVAGLGEESLVKYNGVKVGMISNIELSQTDPEQVKILLKIEAGTPITTSTYATLITQGITGNTYLGLAATSPTFTPLEKTPGEAYPVIPYKPSFFNQLEKNIDDVSVGIKRILSKENARHLKESLANLQLITSVIANNNKELNKSLREMPSLIKDFKNSIVEFNKMTNDVANAGKQISKTMKAGRNTIDKISQQAVPPAVLLLRRLDMIAANIEQVSVDLRQNPAVIIRGSATQQKGPGE